MFNDQLSMADANGRSMSSQLRAILLETVADEDND